MPPLAYVAANAEGVLEGAANCKDTKKEEKKVLFVYKFEYVKTCKLLRRELCCMIVKINWKKSADTGWKTHIWYIYQEKGFTELSSEKVVKMN